MTEEEKIKAFAQKVILTQTGKHMDIDDINGEEGEVYILALIDWVNLFTGELELETDWQYLRDNESNIGTIASYDNIISLPDGVRKLVVNGHRPLTIRQGDAIISTWDVVSPNVITQQPEDPYRGRVATINNKVVFSRRLDDTELGGTVHADIIRFMPQLAANDASVISLIRPTRLLALGVAKDATLPDFVRGGISPSLGQKYADLLEKAVDENEASTMAEEMIGEDFGRIRGVY